MQVIEGDVVTVDEDETAIPRRDGDVIGIQEVVEGKTIETIVLQAIVHHVLNM